MDKAAQVPLPTDHASGDGAAEISAETLNTRAKRGVVILAVRTALVQLTVLGGQIALARLLDPRDFGIFAIVQFALQFFGFFGDAGLGAALIQKKVPPTHRELSSVFFVQVAIATAIIAVVGVAAGMVRWIWPDLSAEAPWLLRALSLSLLLTALRTVPAILMERDLHFGKLAVIDAAVSLAFYVVAATLAWAGWGVWALIAAVLTQGVVGAVLAFAFRPFRPSLVIDGSLLRPILNFGVSFQLNHVVGFLNGAVTPIYAGAKLGARSLGLLNWAQSTAYFPLKLVEIVGRVTFPLYSRLVGDEQKLGEAFGRSVWLCACFTSFFVALFLGMGHQVTVVVFGEKWLAAVPLLAVYASAISIGFFAPLAGALFDSLGKPQLVLRLALAWTTLNWLVVPFATARWALSGFALGYCVHVIVGNVVMMALCARLVPHVRLLRRLWPALVSGALVWLLSRALGPMATGVLGFVGCAGLLFASHLFVLLLVDRRGFFGALSLVPASNRAK
jgi:PST family polysaccharide transporter